MGPIFSMCVYSQIRLHYIYICAKCIPKSVQPFDFWIVDPLNPPPPNTAVGYRGANCFRLCPFPDESTDVYRIWSQLVHPFGSLNVWPPKTPRNAPCGIEGRIVFSYVHSQTDPQTCTNFGANRSSHLTASPRHLNLWPPKPPPPPMPPGVLWGDLYLTYAHSQMNPQSWTKLVSIGPAVWQLLKTSECLTPLNPQVPPLWLEGKFIWRLSINRWICTCVPHLVPLGPASWQHQQTFECVTPENPQNSPWDIEGPIVFSLCPFPDESADVYQIWCQSVQLFDSFPRLLNVWPLKTPKIPHGILRGDLYLAYVHAQMNPQTWTKVGTNRTASQDFWIVDPLKPPKYPLVPRRAICLAYIHSHMNLHMCAKFGANRPSRFVAFPEFVLIVQEH